MDTVINALGGILLNAIPTFLLILILHFYLKSVFFHPMEKVLHQRDEATAGARKRAEESLAKANEKLREYQEMIDKARGDIYREQEQLRKQFKQEQEAQIATAQEAVKQQVAAAKLTIATETAAARGTLETEARILAGRIADNILQGRAA